MCWEEDKAVCSPIRVDGMHQVALNKADPAMIRFSLM